MVPDATVFLETDKGKSKMKSKLAAAIAMLLTSPAALAITDEEGTSAIQFNFTNPGARSLAMGGAFLALADDATAAYTNPAGLTQLSRREFATEWRRTDFSTPHLADGTFVDPSTASYGLAESHTSGPAFLSAVFPFEHASLAFYRHEAANFRSHFNYVPSYDPFDSLKPFESRIELKDVSYGASLGYALNDRWHVGAGVVWHDFRISSSTRRDFSTRGFPENTYTSQFQRGSDHGIGYVVGLRYLPTDRLAVGMSYRRGPRMEYDVTDESMVEGEREVGLRKKSDFDLPDSYGLGVSYRFNDAFTVGLDVVRVRYSQLTRRLNSAFVEDGLDPGAMPEDEALEYQATLEELRGLRIKDGTEVRLGGEYVFANWKAPVSLRAGVWRDPEHNLHASLPLNAETGEWATVNAMIFSHRTGTQWHKTVGVGVAFNRFSLDAAADFSRYSDAVSVSGVFRF